MVPSVAVAAGDDVLTMVPPKEAVSVYCVMASPPASAGGAQSTIKDWGRDSTDWIRGAVGGCASSGTTVFEVALGGLVPHGLVAVRVRVYGISPQMSVVRSAKVEVPGMVVDTGDRQPAPAPDSNPETIAAVTE